MKFRDITFDRVQDKIKIKKLEQYVAMVEEANKVINLTGFTGDKLWEEGVYESIVALQEAFAGNHEGTLLDIGAGAGFPSIPYVIVHPETKLTIYEPTGKRVKFLQSVSEALGLDINIEQVRAEDVAKTEIFDRITARAVSSLKVLIEISHHLGKNKCEYAFIKGPKASTEIEEAKDIIEIFNVDPGVHECAEIENKEINIIKYTKKSSTPKGYPRSWATITK